MARKLNAGIVAGALLLSFAAPSSAQQQGFIICVAEFERDCPTHDVYVTCTDSVRNKASSICKAAGGSGEATLVKVTDKYERRCGTATFRAICR